MALIKGLSLSNLVLFVSETETNLCSDCFYIVQTKPRKQTGIIPHRRFGLNFDICLEYYILVKGNK